MKWSSVLLMAASMASCSNKDGATAPNLSASATSVSVTGSAPVLGKTSQLTAVATFSNGSSQDVTTQVAWWSSNQSIAWVSQAGVLTGVALGAVNVTATLGSLSTLLRVVVTPDDPSPLESAITQRYQQEFGETMPRPALFRSNTRAACTDPIRVTTTAWLDPSASSPRLLTLYTSADGGTVILRQSASLFIRPAGVFRFLLLLVRYPETTGENTLANWEQAQAGINSDHAAFAASKGFDGPIVTFANTNVILDASLVADPRTPSGVTTALANAGHAVADFDIVATVNLDPTKSEGGAANVGTKFIYMGNYGAWKANLTASEIVNVSRAVYGHEVAHLWGWPGTHDWATCTSGTPGNQFGFNFWVPPVLLGWEDLDGDGLPEIKDPTPYGRP